ncbi:hypothetical protein [Pseudomonas sp. Gutcm_11s]|uniref:hypothetical protein n=1 Tax=Pseudomonas sp. Gutcm_11s TaxID=3026088 RepID=UPI00235F34DD|nr:hypothetical protein [Pseudomonas sp. Gutcm_11s]MDD0843092.1 hypothetical protein [Pseudomonas sp. Gutcm_11s]
MVGSDDELRETEERLDRSTAEPAQDNGDADAEEQPLLNDVAPSSPEDVARKILRDALKSFPIPGKK